VTARDHVLRARRALLSVVVLAAGLWAAVAVLVVLVGGAGVDLLVPLPVAARQLTHALAAIAAAGTATLVAWRGRHARSLQRVALYLEERTPALQFALATALDGAVSPTAEILEGVVNATYQHHALRRPIIGALTFPLFATGVTLAVLLALPMSVRDRVLRPRPGDILERRMPGIAAASRLRPLIVRVEPPRYARQAARSLEEPSAVTAVVGSRLVLLGRGARGATIRIGADLGNNRLPVITAGDTWSVSFPMPVLPSVVRLHDRQFTRLLVLEPHPDSLPAAVLLTPTRDSTYQVARGTITFSARVSDDIGLHVGVFELRHSSGGGELFSTKRWLAGGVSFSGARSGIIELTARLDTMHLGPGDVLHVRAVAIDENDVTGQDSGFSDTRTIRIDDPRARDTLRIVSSTAAPLDTTLLSERLLIMQAESLLSRRLRTTRGVYLNEARSLSGRQDQLRTRVEELISTPEVQEMTADPEEEKRVGTIASGNVASLLHEASRAMVDAESRLSSADVGEALPHMRRALQFLDHARRSPRLYLRGVIAVESVDLGKVRLTGEDKVTVAGREPRRERRDPRESLLARVDRAFAGLAADRGRLADTLTMIRVDALVMAPDAAEPLARAIALLHQQRDPSAPLRLARRKLQRATQATPALPGWQQP
jgi:hypothetical protein